MNGSDAMAPQLVPLAQRLNWAGVFAHAAVSVKLVMAALVLAALISIGLWALRLAGRGGDGAIGFLSGVVVTAPLFGLAVAGFDLTHICVGIANLRPAPDLTLIAPGLAEAGLAATLGVLAAGVAAALRAHLQAIAGRGAA